MWLGVAMLIRTSQSCEYRGYVEMWCSFGKKWLRWLDSDALIKLLGMMLGRVG